MFLYKYKQVDTTDIDNPETPLYMDCHNLEIENKRIQIKFLSDFYDFRHFNLLKRLRPSIKLSKSKRYKAIWIEWLWFRIVWQIFITEKA